VHVVEDCDLGGRGQFGCSRPCTVERACFQVIKEGPWTLAGGSEEQVAQGRLRCLTRQLVVVQIVDDWRTHMHGSIQQGVFGRSHAYLGCSRQPHGWPSHVFGQTWVYEEGMSEPGVIGGFSNTCSHACAGVRHTSGMLTCMLQAYPEPVRVSVQSLHAVPQMCISISSDVHTTLLNCYLPPKEISGALQHHKPRRHSS
jgi:hypothetical protein